MDLKIDINLLKDIDFNEYAYLYYAYYGIPCPIKLNIDYSILDDKGYVHVIPDMEGVSYTVNLRAKATNLFDVKDVDSKFLEFWGTYPVKAGTRILKAVDSDTKEGKDIKKKYLTLIKKPGMHEKIMLGLTNELASRKKDGSLVFMQLISTWINAQTWEKYQITETTSDTYTIDV